MRRYIAVLAFAVACGPTPPPQPPEPPPDAPGAEACIHFGDATCLVDDPAGLMRVGPGRNARGSSGPNNVPGRLIEVTSAAGDASLGSLRWAYAQIAGPSKVRLTSALDGQVIRFPANFQFKWDKPYTTLDCSATSARITTFDDKPFSQALVIGGTHDVVVFGCGGLGHFNEAHPQVPANNMSVISLANFVPVRYPWDDLWGSTPAALRGTPRSILLDRVSCSNAQDDCFAIYDGARDVTISRFLNRRGWHPMTCGSNGYKAPGDPKERLRVAWLYGATYKLGARQIRAWRGCREMTFARNVLAEWEEWVAPGGPITPNGGLWFEDDAAGENARAYVVGNLGLPGADNPTNGCFVGNDARCDACGTCRPGVYADCNPKMVNTPWYFSQNSWGGSRDCVTNPAGYAPPPPFTFDPARPWQKVLDEVGPPLRTAAEAADIAAIRARIQQQ